MQLQRKRIEQALSTPHSILTDLAQWRCEMTAASDHTPIPAGYKRCINCDEIKRATTEFFDLDKRSKDGLRLVCEACRAVRKAAIARYAAMDPEAAAATYYAARDALKAATAIYEADKADTLKAAAYEAARAEERKAYHDACHSAYYAPRAARVAQKAYYANYYTAHAEEQKAYSAAWLKANPDKARAKSLRRRAAKNNLPRLWDSHLATHMHLAFDFTCAYCGSALDGDNVKPHADHYIPIKRKDVCPGTVPWNMIPACAKCNISKNQSMPEPWIRRKFTERADEIITAITAYLESKRGAVGVSQ